MLRVPAREGGADDLPLVLAAGLAAGVPRVPGERRADLVGSRRRGGGRREDEYRRDGENEDCCASCLHGVDARTHPRGVKVGNSLRNRQRRAKVSQSPPMPAEPASATTAGIDTRNPTKSSWSARSAGRTSSGDGEGRNRTGDTTVFSRVLYQLSYLARRLDSLAGARARFGRRRDGRRGRRRTRPSSAPRRRRPR